MPKKGRRPPAVEGGTKEPRRIPVAAQVLGREFDRALGKLLHEGLGKLLGMPTVLPLDGPSGGPPTWMLESSYLSMQTRRARRQRTQLRQKTALHRR